MMMTSPIRLLACFCLSAFSLLATELPQLGMWSWSSKSYGTAEARTEMLAFCNRENISRIDQHLSMKKSADGYEVKYATALRALITASASQKISVMALRGERNMFFAAKHDKTLTELKAILAFNATLPENAKLHGIKYDVEPYLTPEWKAGGASRKTVMLDYLAYLAKARELINNSNTTFKLSVDVPFWWDKPEHALPYKGSTKPFAFHVQDQVDSIGIMSYRRKVKDVIRITEGERQYAAARKLNGSVSPALDTIELTEKEAHITFYGLPPKDFRDALAELQQSLTKDPTVNLIMLHHYRSLKEYLATE